MSDQAITTREEAQELPLEAFDKPTYGSLTSRFVLTLATRLLMLAGLIGTSVIIARRLGSAGLGTLAVLNSTVALAVQVASAGIPSANTYFIAQDRKRLGPVWANALGFGLMTGSLLTLIVLALAAMNPLLFGHISFRLVAIAALSIPFQLVLVLGLNVMLALDRIELLNALDLATPALLFLNAIIIVLVWGAGLGALVSANTAIMIVLGVMLIGLIGNMVHKHQESDPCRPNLQLLKKMLLNGSKFYVSLVAAIIIFRADLLIVNHFRGEAEAGVYAAAAQIGTLLMMAPSVIGTLLFPRVASAPDPRGELTARVTRHTTFLMLVVCLAAIPVSFALPLVYGARFSDATVQLLILLPGICLFGIESVMVQHFTGSGLPVAIPIFWLVTLTVNLGLNLMLVPTFGARAAAFTSLISYALIFTLVAVYFRLKTGNHLSSALLLRRYEFRELLVMTRLGLSK